MVKIVNDTNFEKEVLQSDKVVLVDFWAEWCGPCRQLTPVLEAIAAEMGEKIVICKANVDDAPELASRYAIRSIPMLMIFKEGAVVSTKLGLNSKATLVDWIEAHI